MDFTGKVIFESSIENQTTTIDMIKYTAGTYLVQLETGKGTATQKVVKK